MLSMMIKSIYIQHSLYEYHYTKNQENGKKRYKKKTQNKMCVSVSRQFAR